MAHIFLMSFKRLKNGQKETRWRSEPLDGRRLMNPFHSHQEWMGRHQENLQIINAAEGVERREPSYTAGENADWYKLKENSMEVPYKTKNRRTIWSNSPTPGHVYRDICASVHFSTIYNHQDMVQPKCPSTEEWIKKTVYIYTMEYYQAIKKDEIMSFVATQMDLEIVILSEVSHIEKDKYMISLICGI